MHFWLFAIECKQQNPAVSTITECDFYVYDPLTVTDNRVDTI